MGIDLDKMPVGEGFHTAEVMIEHKVIGHEGTVCLLLRGLDHDRLVCSQFSSFDAALKFASDIVAGAEAQWPDEAKKAGL